MNWNMIFFTRTNKFVNENKWIEKVLIQGQNIKNSIENCSAIRTKYQQMNWKCSLSRNNCKQISWKCSFTRTKYKQFN